MRVHDLRTVVGPDVGAVDPNANLDRFGLTLPREWEPGASLRMSRTYGDLLFLSAHVGVDMEATVDFHGRRDHHPLVPGCVGDTISLEQALGVAQGGALNLISTMRHELGDLRRVAQILRVTIMVTTIPGFDGVHKVADAASDLLIAVFGTIGQHSRTTIGTNALPGGAVFAMDAIVAFAGRPGREAQ